MVFISIASVAVCVFDKHHARKRRRRISERTLLILSALGGGAAMYVTMRIIRHKTLHNKFMLGIPLIILIELVALLFAYFKFF